MYVVVSSARKPFGLIQPGRPQAGRGRPAPHLLYLLSGIGTYWDLAGHWQSKRYHRESVILTLNSRIYPFSGYNLLPLRKEPLTSCCSPVTFMNSRVSYLWCVRGCSFFVCVGGGHSDIEWLTVVRMVFIARIVLIKLFWYAVSSL